MWQISKTGRLDRLVVFRSKATGYIPIGELRFEGGGANRIGRFAYAKSYLAGTKKRPIDPIGLPLSSRSKPAAPEEVQAAFHDVGPDGWGKGILAQAFPALALSMPECLALGSTNRTGDLAFGPTPDAPATWAPDTPPLVRLPSTEDDVEALVRAAEAVDQGHFEPHHLQYLLRESANVGGARPKARLRWHGRDYIAKFPAWGDKFDNPRVEAACLDVAEAAGLQAPSRDVIDVAGRSVLLLDRFDRSPEGQPYGYLSAGTLLREPTTSYAGTRKTYVDIADIVRRIGGGNPNPEVFRRWLVNAHLRNTDDHLRNHAVIHVDGTWKLSPVFDVVPHPGRDRHVCAVAPKTSPAWAPKEAAAAHVCFGLTKAEGSDICDEVVTAVRRFPQFLDARGVNAKDKSLLAATLSPLIDTW